jgi:hypothetical protein
MREVFLPSITTWTRIEPKPRDATLSRTLQAQVRDPLWMLARQWQVGEFMGEDAGSPVQATLAVTNRSVSTYRPGEDPSATVALDTSLPLEVHVEREPAVLKLRATVQLGLWFERTLRAAGVAQPTIDVFRTTYAIPPTTPDDGVYDGLDGVPFRTLATGRVSNGEDLYLAATGAPGVPPLPAVATTDPTVAGVLAAFVQYRKSLYSEPDHDRAWQPQQLVYDFGVGSPLPSDNLFLAAPEFGGGHLDWYDFVLSSNDGAPAGLPPATTADVSFAFLPQHVTFRGMPDPRWWTFESGVTDFGALDSEPVDLAKLLVMEFALTYGNDWFIVPVPTDIGSLSTVTTLVVTDTFGQRTLVRPAEQTQVNPGESVWSMFKLSGPNARSSSIFVAPTLGVTDEGANMESVHFLRDDMAAMAWAVEHELHGTLDAPVDAFQAYLARIAGNPITPPTPKPGDPPIFYTLESVVPDNWIPMVPLLSAAGQLVFRRGILERPDGGGSPAHAEVLEPGQPFYLTDRIITRIGTVASIAFRRSRGVDGTTYVWQSRRTSPGPGPGWSGLRFDFLQRFDGSTPNP